MNAKRHSPAVLSGLFAALAMLLVPLAAAQEDQNGENQEPKTALRIAHLSPEGPNVDVLIDGEVRIEDLAPNTVSNYVFLEPGDRSIEVVSFGTAGGRAAAADVDPEAEAGAAAPSNDPAAQDGAAGAGDPAGGVEGAPPTEDPALPDADAQQEPLLETSVTLEEGAYATLVLSATPREERADQAEGEQAEGEQEDAAAEEEQAEQAEGQPAGPPVTVESHLVQDGVQELPAAGEAMVRVVHGAPNAGPVTVVAAHRPEEGQEQEAEQEEAEQQEAEEEEQAEEQEAEQQEGEEEQPEGQEGPPPIEGTQLASGVGSTDTGEYNKVQAGRHHLQVQREDGSVAVDLEDMTFESGLVYTLYVGATEDGESFVITAKVDAGVSADDR